MSRRILFFLIFLVTSSGNPARAQMMAYGEYGVDTNLLNQARSKGLRTFMRIIEDSGKLPDTTKTIFSKRGDSVWAFCYCHEWVDTGTRNILFDGSNHFLFEDDYLHNQFFSKGRTSYYYQYDSLSRPIKESQLESERNELRVSRLFYSNTGDTIVTKDYNFEGTLYEVKTESRDKYGNLLSWQDHYLHLNPDTTFNYLGNVYDSKGRMIEFTNVFSKISPHVSKFVYVDSPGVGIELTYHWSGTNWSFNPGKISRMDSNALILVQTYFDSTGTVVEIDSTKYKTLHKAQRETQRNFDQKWVKTFEWQRDEYGNLISYVVKRDDHIIKTELCLYTYYK